MIQYGYNFRVERIDHPPTPEGSEGLLAIIVRSDRLRFPSPIPRVDFLTSRDEPMQVAIIQHPKGHIIPRHRHYPQVREVIGTQEIIALKQGRMLISVFSRSGDFEHTTVLEDGDVALLLGGGHQLEMLTDCYLLEVKQGPYTPAIDKVHY